MQTVKIPTMTENTPSPNKTDTHDAKKSFSTTERKFRYDDRKYIDRGQLWMLQISQEIMTQGVEKPELWEGRPPVRLLKRVFCSCVPVQDATGIEYRQLQGRGRGDRWQENAPTYSAFQKRITKLGCTFADKGKDGTASVWFSDGGTKARDQVVRL